MVLHPVDLVANIHTCIFIPHQSIAFDQGACGQQKPRCCYSLSHIMYEYHFEADVDSDGQDQTMQLHSLIRAFTVQLQNQWT